MAFGFFASFGLTAQDLIVTTPEVRGGACASKSICRLGRNAVNTAGPVSGVRSDGIQANNVKLATNLAVLATDSHGGEPAVSSGTPAP